MNHDELMDLVCKEYENQTDFSKKFDNACGQKDKLKVLNLLVDNFQCDFDVAQRVCNCFIDKEPLPPTNLSEAQIRKANAEAEELLRKPKCPTCGSTNIQKISVINRGASMAVWGVFSKKINKSFECKKCGYTW